MKKNNFNSKQVTFSFLPHGDIKEVSTTNILINQFIGNEFNGSLNNLFLRVFKEESCQVYPLIGKASNSICETFEEGITWSGEVEGITYQVSFRLSDQDMWFWQVNLAGNSEQVDVIYGQDLGLAARGVIL
ncbi:MAG: cellobiose phosphorylase, partial [Vagococcus sp.]